MTSAELLSELSIQIYSSPLSAHRDSGRIADISDPLSVVMLIVDFDTEVSMNGIHNFIGNSTGLFATETVEALKVIGCLAAADSLKQILEAAAAVGMTHESIRADMSDLEAYAVVSWNQIHGDKWDAASTVIDRLAGAIAWDDVGVRLERYVSDHHVVLANHLASDRLA